MKIHLFDDKIKMAEASARHAADIIRRTIAECGQARILAATGGSQFEMLADLTQSPGIDWTNVELFHLDEYVGISVNHPASFRRYLLDRLIGKTGLRNYHLLDGEVAPESRSAVNGLADPEHGASRWRTTRPESEAWPAAARFADPCGGAGVPSHSSDARPRAASRSCSCDRVFVARRDRVRRAAPRRVLLSVPCGAGPASARTSGRGHTAS